MIKGPSRKQIIIPMTDLNAEFIINLANQKIININRCLKEIKSDISANFTQRVNDGITIITNKPTAVSNLKVIEKSLKSNNKINSDSVDVVATTYHKGQIVSLTSKPQRKYDVGIHKRTRQGVSAKLESYIYKTCLVRATNI